MERYVCLYGGSLPPDSIHKAAVERDDPFSEPCYMSLQSLVNEPPAGFLSEASVKRDAHFQSLLLHIF
jgi:hypothetical protein